MILLHTSVSFLKFAWLSSVDLQYNTPANATGVRNRVPFSRRFDYTVDWRRVKQRASYLQFAIAYVEGSNVVLLSVPISYITMHGEHRNFSWAQ